MRFHYQHACANRIPWLTPNPAGSMTIKKIVLFGVGNSPLGSNFPPTSTPTVTPTPTETSTPTPTETEACGVRNLCEPTPTYTPTLTLVPPTLADYGVTLEDDSVGNRQWNGTEEANILTAVTKIADVFEQFGVIGSGKHNKFKTVMGENITFLRLGSNLPADEETEYEYYYNLFQAAGNITGLYSGYCIVDTTGAIVISCRGNLLASNYWPTDPNDLTNLTVEGAIHELGHIVDARSGTVMRSYIDYVDPTPNSGLSFTLYDCNVERVMGTVGDWQRGQRGWGSAGPLAPNSQELSRFQQNPDNTSVEAIPDMFLNWIYRRSSDATPSGLSGFVPIVNTLTPVPGNPCGYSGGTPTGPWEGFQNILRDGSTDVRLPGNVRYWWMEGTLNYVFTNEGWK